MFNASQRQNPFFRSLAMIFWPWPIFGIFLSFLMLILSCISRWNIPWPPGHKAGFFLLVGCVIFFKKFGIMKNVLNQKVSHFNEKLKPKIYLVPWDHIRVPGYPIWDPRVPRWPENIFSPIFYYNVLINSRFCPIKSLPFDFLGASGQFCSLDFSEEGKKGENMFCFLLCLCIYFKLKWSKHKNMQNHMVVKIKSSTVSGWNLEKRFWNRRKRFQIFF